MAQEDQQNTTATLSPAERPASQAPAANGNGNGNGDKPQDQTPNGGNGNGDEKSGPPSFVKGPLFKILLIVVAVIAIIWGIKYWHYSQNHVSTDDAYIEGDLVNISPIITGTLEKLTVEEGDSVKAGQVIAVLDQSGPRASYQQALAAYQAAQSMVPQAQTTAQYEAASTQAGINQAQATLAAQEAKTAEAQQQVHLTAATTNGQVLQDNAQAAASLAQADTANANAISAQQSVQTALKAASAAHQQVNVAQANYTRAQKDANRYAALYGPNGSVAAVTAQQLDQATAAADSTKATLQATQDQAQQADSQVQEARAEADAAKQTYNAAMKQYAAMQAQVNIAKANRIQVPVQKLNVANNAAIGQQNVAELQAAKAGSQQVTLRKQQVLTAIAQAEQAKAALANAQVTLDDTTITAPSDGVVVRKGVNVGDALSPGQTIVTMTRGDYVWVTANYKETQLQYVRPGQPVEVEVDAFPDKVFHGKVQSVNGASGNTTSLLPADNATGNFTKVVQRIPVKILLDIPKNPAKSDATLADIHNLRQGMSVEADIDVSSARNHN